MVEYHSPKLTPSETNYMVHDKELLAIIDALWTWRHNLLGGKHQITIFSDHQNLECINRQQPMSQRLTRWAIFLTDYDYVIKDQPGRENSTSDALSRRPDYLQAKEDAQAKVLIPKERLTCAATNTSTESVQTTGSKKLPTEEGHL